MNSSGALKWLVLLFLFLITVDGFKTTFLSANVVGVSRYLFSAIIIIGLACLAWRGVPGAKGVLGVLLYFLLVVFSLFMKIVHSANSSLPDQFWINAVLTAVGIFLFAGCGRQIFPSWAAIVYLIYGALFLLIGVFGAGADFFPKSFNFEYYTDREGGTVEYSQGLTRNLGLMLISTLLLYCNSGLFWVRALMLCVAGMVAWLSFIAGSRGELVAAFIVSLLILVFNRKYLLLFGLIASVCSTLLLISDFTLGRFATFLEGDYGMRDVLFSQALALFFSDPHVFLFGCGYGCFQDAYNYPATLYPHNFILEFLITFGFVLTVVFCYFVVCGALRYWKAVEGLDFFLLIFIFYFLVSMKSGDVFGGWMFMASCIYFAIFFVRSKFHRVKYF